MIDQVCRTDAPTWLTVAAWGRRTKHLPSKLAGIAGTMAEYAAEEWKRPPSVKQAKGAIEALKRAREHGVLHEIGVGPN